MKHTNRSAADSTPQDTDPWKHFQTNGENMTTEPTNLHQCGNNIPLATPTELTESDDYRSTLAVWVEQEPTNSPLAGRITIALGHYDGDTNYANMWENLTPDNADKLAQALTHHATIARQHTITAIKPT